MMLKIILLIVSILLCLAVVIGPDAQRRHERILRNAIAKAGQPVLQAAQEADISQAQFTRQLQMLEGSHKRLAMQPVEFWQWYGLAILQEFGLPKEVETAGRVKAALEQELS